MSRRKIVPSGLSVTATVGNAHPMTVPATMAMMIHWVSDGHASRRLGSTTGLRPGSEAFDLALDAAQKHQGLIGSDPEASADLRDALGGGDGAAPRSERRAGQLAHVSCEGAGICVAQPGRHISKREPGDLRVLVGTEHAGRDYHDSDRNEPGHGETAVEVLPADRGPVRHVFGGLEPARSPE